MLRVKQLNGFSIRNGNPKKDNEDGIVIHHHLFAVLDGATGQGGLDGKLASKTIEGVLVSKEEDESLLEVVERANRTLAEVAVEKFEQMIEKRELPSEVVAKYHQGIDEKKKMLNGRELTAEEKVTCIHPAYSTATCGAIMQIDPRKETAEIVQVGDCMVAVQRMDGQVEVLTEDLVARSDYFSYLDYQRAGSELLKRLPPRQLSSISQFYALSKQKQQYMHNQNRSLIKPTLHIGRTNANNPVSTYSYPVFNGTPLNLQEHYQQISLKDVQSIVLLSDGLLISQPKISPDMRKAWQQTAEAAFQKGPEGLLGIVQWQTAVDPYAQYFVDRLKPDDDKTILKIDLEREKQRGQQNSFLPPLSRRDVSAQSFIVRAEPPSRSR